MPLNEAISNVAGNLPQSAEGVVQLVGNPAVLIIGIALIVGAVAVFFLLKRIIANTVAGLIVWAVVYFFFQVELPVLPTLALTVVFGLAGIGSMLILKFFGVV